MGWPHHFRGPLQRKNCDTGSAVEEAQEGALAESAVGSNISGLQLF